MIDVFAMALREALGSVGTQFQARPDGFRERDFELALEAQFKLRTALEVRRQKPLQLGELWSGRVGAVDLSIRASDRLGLVELKWGASELPACAWDSVKLAAALTKTPARAFLAAGYPTARAQAGAELLTNGEWKLGSLLERYASSFAHWRADVQNYPRQLPAAWQTRVVAEQDVSVQGTPWQLRAVELTLTDPMLQRVSYVPVVTSQEQAPHERAEAPAPNAEQRLLVDQNRPA
jgi:hypothetical protein